MGLAVQYKSSFPVILCDHCGDEVKNTDNAHWLFQPDAAKTHSAVHWVHKKCHRVFKHEHGKHAWDTFPILANYMLNDGKFIVIGDFEIVEHVGGQKPWVVRYKDEELVRLFAKSDAQTFVYLILEMAHKMGMPLDDMAKMVKEAAALKREELAGLPY